MKSGPPLPSFALLPPLHLHFTGCPSRYASPALVVGRAGRGFSIIPAGFGCEVGIDAWVGVCRWGAPAEI